MSTPAILPPAGLCQPAPGEKTPLQRVDTWRRHQQGIITTGRYGQYDCGYLDGLTDARNAFAAYLVSSMPPQDET